MRAYKGCMSLNGTHKKGFQNMLRMSMASGVIIIYLNTRIIYGKNTTELIRSYQKYYSLHIKKSFVKSGGLGVHRSFAIWPVGRCVIITMLRVFLFLLESN